MRDSAVTVTNGLAELSVICEGLNWPGSGTLQSADVLSVPTTWDNVTPAPTNSSYTVTPALRTQQYFRLRQ